MGGRVGDREAGATFGSTGPQGHRGRMRGRLLAGATALADYEVLEMLLFLGVPRRDTKPQAKGLINRFGSLAGALTAERPALREAGLEDRAIDALGLIRDAARHLAQAERVERVLLGDWLALERYLDPARRSAGASGLAVLLLNNRNQLLGECVCAEDAGAAGVTRQVLRQALERHATAAILVRSLGAAAPAIDAADRALFSHVQRAAAALSVVVHDFVVVGRSDWMSLRQAAGQKGGLR